MAEIAGHRVADFDACKNVGDFYFTEPKAAEGGARRLSFLCPCGCGDLCGIRVRDDGKNVDGSWEWNLNMDNPTCKPSITINLFQSC
jgi:Family of unknown function (DUF6527)